MVSEQLETPKAIRGVMIKKNDPFPYGTNESKKCQVPRLDTLDR